MAQRIIIFGAGGHGKVVIESLRASHPEVEIALLDDHGEAGSRVLVGLPLVGGRAWLEKNWPGAPVMPALGQNVARGAFARWLTESGRGLATIIDPSVRLSLSAKVGAGSFLAPASVINADTILEEAVIVNTAATIDHDCRIGFAAHIAPGAHLCGGVQIGAETLVGTGSVVIPGVRIGRGAVVAAGAAVTRDVADGERVGGVPARPLRG